jgi:AraC-like DNA-binding protein
MNSQTDFEREIKKNEKLKNESYLDLEKVFWNPLNKYDSIKRLKYAKAYLRKAKKDKDTLEIANAFFMMTYSNKRNVLTYLDSVIYITKNKSYKSQPINAYILKATIFGQKNNFKKALFNLEKANYHAKINGNILQLNDIKYLISRFKTSLGDYESAKKLQKELITYYKSNNYFGFERAYIVVSEAYANSLNFLQQPDSALQIVKNLIPLSLKTTDSVIYYKLLISSAISNYQKGNFKTSLDSIIKLKEYNKKKIFSTDINILINLYEGKNYLQQHNEKLAIKSFEKVDSISSFKNYIHTYVRENYTLMYNYYREKNDIKNQLYYINKLLVTDSILDTDLAYLVKNVNSKFTTPNLIEEKQKIIKSLKNRVTNRVILISILLIFCIVCVLIIIKNNSKKKLYLKRIVELETPKKENSYIIDDEISKKILDDLIEIEKSDVLLQKEMNLTALAKKLNTNTSYISKIINEHKQKTFKQYLVDYRIRVLIKQLDENPIMRKYSIEALADSVGYTNASSFTRIFKNYTGASPSEYFKKKYKK